MNHCLRCFMTGGEFSPPITAEVSPRRHVGGCASFSGSIMSLIVVVAAFAGGCQTFETYGRVYPDSRDAVAGVERYPVLLDRQKATAQRREAAVGVDVSRRLERCEILRAQLVHASQSAAGHVGLVWGCPVIWPVDILSLLFFPIGETQKAQAVWTEAERLERAYQSDTASFLTTCEQVEATAVGRAFSKVLVTRERTTVATTDDGDSAGETDTDGELAGDHH